MFCITVCFSSQLYIFYNPTHEINIQIPYKIHSETFSRLQYLVNLYQCIGQKSVCKNVLGNSLAKFTIFTKSYQYTDISHDFYIK